MSISNKDRQRIREVAKQQAEFAAAQKNKQLKEDWILHNSCELGRPLVTVELWTFYNDIIPQLLQCESDEARNIESSLISNYANQWLFNDDTVVKDYFPVGITSSFKPYDIDVLVDYPDIKNPVGHHFVEQIIDLKQDFYKLKKSTYSMEKINVPKDLELYGDLFGDILPVKLKGNALYAVPTQNIVHIMSMENMLISMYDYPEEFHKMMDQQANDYIEYFNYLQSEDALLSATEGQDVGNGTYAYTKDLPNEEQMQSRAARTKDLWGYLDSQETVGISPDMYGEFIFPYYKRISEIYGLLSYGCCEPVNLIWEKYLSKLSNLRKLSISPWCDEQYIGEQLRDKKIVYHRKPNPNYLGVGKNLDEKALRDHFRTTLKAARGCSIEFSQRDVYTLNNTYEKVRRYVEICREEIANEI